MTDRPKRQASVSPNSSTRHNGESVSTQSWLPLVYEELRRLAAAKLASEPHDVILQPTALVHEAFLRLSESTCPQVWDNRRHFIAAAASAMRRILVEQARRRQSLKAGGGWTRIDCTDIDFEATRPTVDLLVLHDALELLSKQDPRASQVVQLRFFSGCTLQQAAESLGVALSTAENDWAYAKSWLKVHLVENQG